MNKHSSFMSGDLHKDLTSAGRLGKEVERFRDIFAKNYPRTTELDNVTTVLHFVGMHKDFKVSNKHMKLGVVPTFKSIETIRDFEKGTQEVKEKHFKGSFLPLKILPRITSKYPPHQGKEEIARRLKKVAA